MREVLEDVEQIFLKDVKDHKIDIVKDDGVHRFVRFRRADRIVYWFDLITWPGCLCIQGDMGCYVFSRLHDMFEFFPMDKSDFNYNRSGGLSINPGYWGEKLQAVGTNAGYKEFDVDVFLERVKEHVDTLFEDSESSEEKNKKLWEEIEEAIEYCENEYDYYKAIHDFDYEGFLFQDFFDGGGTEKYTFHYLWSLFAIVWGIQKYNGEKVNERERIEIS